MANLGLQNNNPGNLKDPSTGQFRVFNSPEEGQQALVNDISLKQSGKSSHIKPGASISQLASVWAPASDNNVPANWANNVATHLGVSTDTPFDSIPPEKLAEGIKVAEGTSTMPTGDHSSVGHSPLAQKIRAKYPTQYNDLTDAQLEQKVLAKYPQYTDLANSSNNGTSSPTPTQAPTGESNNNWLQGIITDPLKTLLIKPAIRTGQALGSLGVEGANYLSGGKINDYLKKTTGQDLNQRLDYATSQPVDVGMGPLGTATVEPVKAFGQGGGEQIAGEGLKSAAEIGTLAVPGAKVAGIPGMALRTGLYGATGAGIGAGNAMTKGKGASEVTSEALKGGALGLAGGAIGEAGGGLLSRLLKGQDVLNSSVVQDAIHNYIPEDVGKLGPGGLEEALNRPVTNSAEDIYNALSQEIGRTSNPAKTEILKQALEAVKPEMLKEGGGTLPSLFSKLNLGGRAMRGLKWGVGLPAAGALLGLGNYAVGKALGGNTPTSLVKKAVIPNQ